MTTVINQYEVPGIRNRTKLMIAIVAVACYPGQRFDFKEKITRDATSQHSRLNDQTY